MNCKELRRLTAFLARYYKIRRMKVVVGGRRVANSDEALHDDDTCTAYFKKKGIDKFNVLHEFYHHLVYVNGWDISEKREKRS
ncbi:MAG: hypothetical protein ACETWE_02595 [Candidatus Bathyarchaeia archaeon]